MDSCTYILALPPLPIPNLGGNDGSSEPRGGALTVLKQAVIEPSPLDHLPPLLLPLPLLGGLLVMSFMLSDSEGQPRRIPTLVSYCQRGQSNSARSAS